ncbi:MAG: flagellar filament capping protein FliD [Pseudomonadota bacterium]
MTDAISSSLGNLTIDPSTNKARMSSMSSGLDTEALIGAMVDAKKIPAVRFEQKIEVGEAKVLAYEELQGALTAMQSALEGLRNPPGLMGADENLFERKDAYFSSNTTTQPATLLGIQATNAADVGSFDLRIGGLATSHKVMSNAVADPAALGLAAGTLTLGLGSGTTADIAVDDTTTLSGLRDAINAQRDTTGVSASILKVSDTEQRLVLTGQETGLDQTITVAGDAANLTMLGFADPANELQAAANAEFWVDDIAVERPTNTITDLYDGLTIDLYQAEPGTTVTVEVEANYAEAREQVQTFVDAYNDLRDFIDQQTAVGETGDVDKLAAPLFGDSVLRSLTQSLGLELGSAVQGLGADAPSTLGELGITLERDNRLKLDTAKLDELLLTDPKAVRRVFEFDATIDNPDLAIYDRPNSLPSNAFTVEKVGADWILDDGTDTITLEASGGTLKAPGDSSYAGLTMFYVGAADPTAPITIQATQGIADRLYNVIENATGVVDGTLAEAIESTEGQIETWQEDIDRINERADAYREVLIERFGRLETALSLSESMLNQIRTQTDAMFASD